MIYWHTYLELHDLVDDVDRLNRCLYHRDTVAFVQLLREHGLRYNWKTKKIEKRDQHGWRLWAKALEAPPFKGESSHGISVAEARQLRSGGRCCDICGRKQKLEVDHNHDTGDIRGVLCSRCNGALGQFRDSKKLLLKAIAYLEETDGNGN